MSARPQIATRRSAPGAVVSAAPPGTARARSGLARGRAAATRRAIRRRRTGAIIAVAILAALAGALVWPLFHHAVREITLPLRHDDIIRQQARAKDLDPALLAAVIYAESHFRDGQTSSAGAKGLMQL